MLLGAVCAQPTADLAQTQISDALNAALVDKLHQRHPDLDADDGQFEFQLQAVAGNLAPCTSGVDVDWRGQELGGRLTPRVSCDAEGWQLYVPVTVAIHLPVVVTSGNLDRGHRLTAADLRLQSIDIASLRQGYFESADDLLGYQLARNVNAGQVVTPYLAEPPMLVDRGDRVYILAKSGPLSVRTLGEALRQGRAGEQIPVRNLSSGETIHAYIIERGVVETASR
ncbi:flagellar basal body P-ring formation chaperone FlgA [Saccharospirillum mangrovi]|nr:flagellar basal body P-ring formation chaperone FlgA [Saccharospirillum mangrovi]